MFKQGNIDKLNTFLKRLDGRAVTELNNFGMKVVKVKEIRECVKCSTKIRKGNRALTFTEKNGIKRIRRWACDKCSIAIIKKTKGLSDAWKEADMWEEPDWDDGKSSNGY